MSLFHSFRCIKTAFFFHFGFHITVLIEPIYMIQIICKLPGFKDHILTQLLCVAAVLFVSI